MDKASEDARVFGATEESIAAAHGPAEKDFHVWPENWPAVKAFLSVGSQWARNGMGAVDGLDYTRARSGLELAGIVVTPELWQKVRVMEATILSALNKEKPGK